MERSEITDEPTDVSRVSKVAEDSITMENGWTIGCSLPDVKVGDLVEQWGQGIGFRVRGLAVGGRVDWYRTEEQETAYNAEQSRLYHVRKREEFEAEKDSLDAQFKALPQVLKDRIQGFRNNGGEQWRIDFESYEMFCSTEAVKIADWCWKHGVSVNELKAMTWDEQVQVGISNAHSGNTRSMSFLLAKALMDNVSVQSIPGALSPVSGAKASGHY